MGINCFDFEATVKGFLKETRETLGIAFREGKNDTTVNFYMGKESVLCDLLEYFGIEED